MGRSLPVDSTNEERVQRSPPKDQSHLMICGGCRHWLPRSGSGGGWAVLDGDEIEERIFFHRGDDSAFRSVRKVR